MSEQATHCGDLSKSYTSLRRGFDLDAWRLHDPWRDSGFQRGEFSPRRRLVLALRACVRLAARTSTLLDFG